MEMATNSIGFHEWLCLCNGTFSLSVFKIKRMQEIFVYFALGIALAYLYNKFFGKKKPKKNCGDDNCGCN